MIRVVCQQLSPRLGNLPFNHALSVRAVREAVEAGADVVVLPELVTCGYNFSSEEEARRVAIAADHQIFAEWSQLAAQGEAVVIGGFCEQGPHGGIYNSAALVDGSGVLAVYRKTHLWNLEKVLFVPGEAVPPVLNTSAARIGVLVCYDLEFPEMPRSLALAGAELVAVPTNWPLSPRPLSERPPEMIQAMAAARSNRISVACCDRAGEERAKRVLIVLSPKAEDGMRAQPVDLRRHRGSCACVVQPVGDMELELHLRAGPEQSDEPDARLRFIRQAADHRRQDVGAARVADEISEQRGAGRYPLHRIAAGTDRVVQRTAIMLIETRRAGLSRRIGERAARGHPRVETVTASLQLREAEVRTPANSLADPTDLLAFIPSSELLNDRGEPDPDKITGKAAELAEQKPHLAALRTVHEVGQGPRGMAPQVTDDLGRLIRAAAR